MRLATWNVNSIRARLSNVVRFLERTVPDVLLLQEIKCETEAFPEHAFAGYQAVVAGQKSYNGVAMLCRPPFTRRCIGLPGIESDEARYIEIEVGGVVIGNLYAPNGNSGGEQGFAAKLAWLDALDAHARGMLDDDVDFILAGDFNICPTDVDAAPGALSTNDALIRPEVRSRFRRLLWHGLTDAVRAQHPIGPAYTFWDYQGGAWDRDLGLRIDHILLSPAVVDRLEAIKIERDERSQPQPSDHVPVLVTLKELAQH